jgi:uncharacterized DUF497 family protein
MAASFEWDPRKAADNYAKHGVGFDEASRVFGDPLGGLLDDPRHSKREERFVMIGSSRNSRLLAVMFTEERIGIISARRVTRTERKAYEENPR